MIGKKLRSRLGLTLAETLTALAIFSIFSVALVQGTNAAWNVYRKAVVASEARTLQSTLAQSLSNELRYGRNIQVDGGTVSFDSDTFGEKVSVETVDDRVIIHRPGKPAEGIADKKYDLLPEKAYTGGLKAEAAVSFQEDLFTLEITIKHPLLPADGRKTTLTVQPLNPPESTTEPQGGV